MTELTFDFRRGGHVSDQWRGRWLRGIELDQQRFEASAARQRQLQAAPNQSKRLDPHRVPSIALLEAWAPVEDRLRQAVDVPTFRIWLAPLHSHSLIGGTWRLAYRPEGIGWIRDRFGRLIEGCAGRPVEFVVCEALR